jgi:DNA invertase Pin-like site-specific DNA recombinase
MPRCTPSRSRLIPIHPKNARNHRSTDSGLAPHEATSSGVKVEFVKESLTFAGDDSPMNTLLLSMLGAVAEFERSMILERQREGIAIAKAAGKYKGRKASLSQTQASELRERLAKGESVTALATEYGVSRQTVYNYKIA